MADPAAASLDVTGAPKKGRGAICVACGYDLQNITSDNCPECGLSIDRVSTVVPWVHRHRIGWWNAYWRTVRMGTFHVSALADEIDFQQPWRDARLFRRITATLAFLPLGLMAGWILTQHPVYEIVGNAWPDKWGDPWFEEAVSKITTSKILLLVTMEAALWLAIYGATGVAGFLFLRPWKPVERRNNAVTLSHYTCGSLAMLALLLVPCIVVAAWLMWKHQLQSVDLIDDHVIELIAIPAITAMILWCFATARLLAKITRRIVTAFCAPIYLLLTWSFLLAIGPLLLTAVAAYVEIIWASLR